jgi:hypothetical protein
VKRVVDGSACVAVHTQSCHAVVAKYSVDALIRHKPMVSTYGTYAICREEIDVRPQDGPEGVCF